MPYKTWGCGICGMQAPKKLRAHGMFAKRMKWLRDHYKKYHPEEFARMIKNAAKARRFK